MTTEQSCAFADCDAVRACALPGGCVRQRYGSSTPAVERIIPKSKALNGTKARASNDPVWKKRRRVGPHR